MSHLGNSVISGESYSDRRCVEFWVLFMFLLWITSLSSFSRVARGEWIAFPHSPLISMLTHIHFSWMSIVLGISKLRLAALRAGGFCQHRSSNSACRTVQGMLQTWLGEQELGGQIVNAFHLTFSANSCFGMLFLCWNWDRVIYT